MIAKLLLTLLVVALAWLALRRRLREDADVASAGARSGSSIPVAAVRLTGYALVGLMLFGSGVWLYTDWRHRRELVTLQVVNPYTGAVQSYQVRRGDIDRRSFRTTDGRQVRIAEMERMVVEERR